MIDYPELNVDLLDKTFDHIKTLEAFKAEGVAMDEHWRQGSWGIQGPECGTAMCFAGWACRLAGLDVVPDPHHAVMCYVKGLGRTEARHLAVRGDDGKLRSIADEATRLLGLQGSELNLYDGSNELHDLEEIVDEIKRGVYRPGEAA